MRSSLIYSIKSNAKFPCHAFVLGAPSRRHRRSGRSSWRAIASPFMYCEHECTLEGWRRPLGTSSKQEVDVPIVALGKFDALHRGHRALASAAADLGGSPWLVSFSGMAEILGWPSRLPLVAPCDRRRVMLSWKDACLGRVPFECSIPFGEIRAMSPEDFVSLLANELRVAGVVVGSNYRFGYKAAGTAQTMQELGSKYGLRVRVVDLVAGTETWSEEDSETEPPTTGTISSSIVRKALALGDMGTAEFCLGRPYRLVVDVSELRHELLETDEAICLPVQAFLNQPPCPGTYEVQAYVAQEENELPLDEGGVHIEVGIEHDCLRIRSKTSKESFMELLQVGSTMSTSQKNCRLMFDFLVDAS